MKILKSGKIIFFLVYMCSVILVADIVIKAEFLPIAQSKEQIGENDSKTGQTVKVAVYELPGFASKEEEKYTGYEIEYLSRLAKYTGWTYEYVECESSAKALELVAAGAVDIAGGIQKSQNVNEDVEFCEYTSGNMYDCMVTMFVNELIYGDYEAFGEITIGCTQEYIHQKEFIEYANENGYSPRLTYFDTLEQMRNALYEGRVDAMLINSMERLPDSERIIDKFFSKPFYFVTNKKDTEMTQMLKDGLAGIKVNEPDLENALATKYFDDTGAFPYTKAELEYLVNAPVVKVGINKDRMPIAYKNVDGKDVGITIDIMNLIEGYSGLEFELVDIGDKPVAQVLKEGEVDLVAAVTDKSCQEIADSELEWSEAYFESVAAFVGKNGFEFKANGSYKVGVVDNNGLYTSYVGENYPECEIIGYKDVEDALNDVVKGKIHGLIENTYVVNAMLLKPYYSELRLVPTVNISEKLRFVGLRDDGFITSIINKTVASITEDEINTCILHYTVASYDYTIGDFLYKYRIQIIIALPLLIVLLALVLRIKGLKKKAEYDLLKERSQRDVLTKLYNKAAFRNLVETFLEDEGNKDRKCALIFVDVDNFKSVNDKLGHMVGDETLVKIAGELNNCTREKDIVARFGGDEFCLFVVDMSHSGVKSFAQRTIEALSFGCSGKEEEKKDIVVNVSASVGIALYPDNARTYDELIECADKAVYEVKAEGKNGYRIFGQEKDSDKAIVQK